MQSLFRFFSFGIVTEDKYRTTDMIKVFPTEHFTNVDMNVTKDTLETGSLQDFNGDYVDFKVKKGTIINAKWLGMGRGNRVTSPDMTKGEIVMIYKFADADLFYWEDCYNESDVRKLESMVVALSNTPEGNTELNLDNSYYLAFSTHDKHLRIHLSKNDGEATSYDIEVDAKKGIFYLLDGEGNKINLDSLAGKLTSDINNEVETNTKKFVVNADIVELNCKNYTNNATVKASTVSPKIVEDGELTVTKGGNIANTIYAKDIITDKGSMNDHNHKENNNTVTEKMSSSGVRPPNEP